MNKIVESGRLVMKSGRGFAHSLTWGKCARLALGLALLTAALVLSGYAQELGRYHITIDVPGALYTEPTAINRAGIITGWFAEIGNNVGFVRNPGGTYTTFGAPGGLDGTYPQSISEGSNAVTGVYVDENAAFHGFVRDPSGALTTFDAPGAGTGENDGTFAGNIADDGVVVGYYTDGSGNSHGFVRGRFGQIRSFDAPGAGTGSGQGTFIPYTSGLNDLGAIVGYYIDTNSVAHGFVRGPRGDRFTTFDAPGAGSGEGEGTLVTVINDHGSIAGYYFDASGTLTAHGFVRAPDGAFTTFDAPGAGTGVSQGTFPTIINPGGEIIGHYVNGLDLATHAFLRTAQGAIFEFDYPRSGHVYTLPADSNAEGAIVGVYGNPTMHGFLILPPKP